MNEPHINSGGKCAICKQQKIEWSIRDGNYTYFCHHCKKFISRHEVETGDKI